MLFDKRLWPLIADGSVTVAVRRWKRPSVKTGGTLQSPAGLLAIDTVEPVSPGDLSESDARCAGFPGLDELLASLRPEGQLSRIRFHRVGDDPRVSLRQRTELGPAELAKVITALRRLDWAGPVLESIGRQPGVVSTELAAELGMERFPFKQKVRRLKALGLTESLKVGYRLSPRGQVVLDAIRDAAGQ